MASPSLARCSHPSAISLQNILELTISPAMPQDGPAAGQTVPHVHFHILPRKIQGDTFQSNRDAIYPAIEEAESELHADLERATRSLQKRSPAAEPLKMDADAERKPRELEEMIKEAEWLRSFFEAEKPAHRLE